MHKQDVRVTVRPSLAMIQRHSERTLKRLLEGITQTTSLNENRQQTTETQGFKYRSKAKATKLATGETNG